MDHAELKQLLVAVRAHVAMGRRHVTRQRQTVAGLEGAGAGPGDLAVALELLWAFERSQALHFAKLAELLLLEQRLAKALPRLLDPPVSCGWRPPDQSDRYITCPVCGHRLDRRDVADVIEASEGSRQRPTKVGSRY
jgi:hypothetical protein